MGILWLHWQLTALWPSWYGIPCWYYLNLQLQPYVISATLRQLKAAITQFSAFNIRHGSAVGSIQPVCLAHATSDAGRAQSRPRLLTPFERGSNARACHTGCQDDWQALWCCKYWAAPVQLLLLAISPTRFGGVWPRSWAVPSGHFRGAARSCRYHKWPQVEALSLRKEAAVSGHMDKAALECEAACCFNW